MSDPVSSMDVEDVLSSIRRLVSEEAKGNGMAGESASTIASADLHEAAETSASGALSHIVQAVEYGGDGSAGGSAYGTGTPPSNEIMQDTGASLELDENEPEDGQVSFRHNSRANLRKDNDQRLVLTAALRVADHGENTPDGFGPPAEDVVASPDVPAQEMTAHPHLRSVKDMSNDDATGGSGGSSGSGGDLLRQVIGAPQDTLFDRARQAMEAVRGNNPDRRDAPDLPVTDEAPAETRVEPVAPLAEPIDTSTATAGISSLRRTVAETTPEADVISPAGPQEPIDESSPASPFSATGGAFTPPLNTEAEAGSEITAEVGIDEPSTINFAEEDPSILDEDTLRDLVSDMVREELQGELGDRITRNVRKLVRREIQRAMASREFE